MNLTINSDLSFKSMNCVMDPLRLVGGEIYHSVELVGGVDHVHEIRAVAEGVDITVFLTGALWLLAPVAHNALHEGLDPDGRVKVPVLPGHHGDVVLAALDHLDHDFGANHAVAAEGEDLLLGRASGGRGQDQEEDGKAPGAHGAKEETGKMM